jgi:hypothetical protein
MKGMLQTVKRKLSNTGDHMAGQSPDRVDMDGPKLSSTSSATNVNGNAAPSPVVDIARSDVSLPKRERRRSFLARNQKIQALKDLPHLKDTALQRREVRAEHQCESNAVRGY